MRCPGAKCKHYDQWIPAAIVGNKFCTNQFETRWNGNWRGRRRGRSAESGTGSKRQHLQVRNVCQGSSTDVTNAPAFTAPVPANVQPIQTARFKLFCGPVHQWIGTLGFLWLRAPNGPSTISNGCLRSDRDKPAYHTMTSNPGPLAIDTRRTVPSMHCTTNHQIERVTHIKRFSHTSAAEHIPLPLAQSRRLSHTVVSRIGKCD